MVAIIATIAMDVEEDEAVDNVSTKHSKTIHQLSNKIKLLAKFLVLINPVPPMLIQSTVGPMDIKATMDINAVILLKVTFLMPP